MMILNRKVLLFGGVYLHGMFRDCMLHYLPTSQPKISCETAARECTSVIWSSARKLVFRRTSAVFLLAVLLADSCWLFHGLETRLIEAETLPNIAQHNHLKHMVFLRWGSEPFEKTFMNTEHIFLVVCFLLYVCVLLSRFSSRNKHDSFNNVHSLVMGP